MSENKKDNGEIHFAKSENKKSKSRIQHNKKRIVLNIVGIFLSVVFILCGSGVLYVHGFLARINYKELNITSKPESSAETSKNNETSETSVPQPQLHVGDLLNDPMVLNIMLFGADRRSQDEYGRTDTMMLLSIDTRHEKLKMLSFQRDTYVAVPEYENNKLAHAYAFGGAELAVQTIQNNYGIKIDRYAIVDFNSFTAIIDTLGGIDIELTDEEIDYINWQCWKNKQVETRHELTNTAGVVHLNGRQALWHARNRGEDGICSGDDFTRTQRQRAVMDILFEKMRNSGLTTILNILYQIGPMITTNLKTSEITSLAVDVMTYLNYDVESASFPERSALGTDYSFDDVPDMWGNTMNCIIINDWYDFRKKIAVYIYEDAVKS
ncbi:MAG: LCP family protein [Acutalibacteraceae bacterium]